MSSIRTKYEKFCDFMQHNTKGVEVCLHFTLSVTTKTTINK